MSLFSSLFNAGGGDSTQCTSLFSGHSQFRTTAPAPEIDAQANAAQNAAKKSAHANPPMLTDFKQLKRKRAGSAQQESLQIVNVPQAGLTAVQQHTSRARTEGSVAAAAAVQAHSSEQHKVKSATGGTAAPRNAKVLAVADHPPSKRQKSASRAADAPGSQPAAGSDAEEDQLVHESLRLGAKRQSAKGSSKGGKKVSATAPAMEDDADGESSQPPAPAKKEKRKDKKDKTRTLQVADGDGTDGAVAAGPAGVAGEKSGSDAGLDIEREKSDDGGSGDDSEDDGTGTATNKAAPVKLTPEEEAEKLSRTLFVGNLPIKISAKALRQRFSKYGAVESVRLRSLPVLMDAKMNRRSAILSKKVDATRGPGTAYVVFADASSLAGALAENMVEVEGHHIRVDRAVAPSKQSGIGKPAAAEYDPMRSIFIGNVHLQVQDEELIRFFNTGAIAERIPELAGSVEAVRVVRDRGNQVGKGFAFVMFKTKVAARAALTLNGTPLRKRELRITRVSARSGTSSANSSKAGVKPGMSGKPAPTFTKLAGPGSKGAAAALLANPSEWQGTQTKGKEKGVRGAKAGSSMSPRSGSRAAAPENRKRSSKRPAVEARRAKKMAGMAGGGGGGMAPKPVIKKKGGGKRPWNQS